MKHSFLWCIFFSQPMYFFFGLCSFLQTSLHNLTVKGKHVGGGGNKDTCGHGGGEEGEGVEVRLERRGGRHLWWHGTWRHRPRSNGQMWRSRQQKRRRRDKDGVNDDNDNVGGERPCATTSTMMKTKIKTTKRIAKTVTITTKDDDENDLVKEDGQPRRRPRYFRRERRWRGKR